MRTWVVVAVIAVSAIFGVLWQILGQPSPLLIESAHAVAKGPNLAVYLSIRNTGAPDRLLGVSSSQAQSAELIFADGGEDGAPIPALHRVSLSPDGGYILLSGVDGDLAAGRLIPVSLSFEHAGDLTFKARIEDGKSMQLHGGEGAICRVERGEPSPALTLRAEPSAVGWNLSIDTQDFIFARELVDGSHVPGTGHAHLYAGGLKLGRLYEPRAQIPALPPGRHIVRVTLNSNDHRTYVVDDKPVTATIEVVAD